MNVAGGTRILDDLRSACSLFASGVVGLLLLVGVSEVHGFELKEVVPVRSGVEPRMSFRLDSRRNELVVEWVNGRHIQSAARPEGPWTQVEGVRGTRHRIALGSEERVRFYRVLPPARPVIRPTEVYVPSDYHEEREYPLILSLHGFASSPAVQERERFPLAYLVDERKFLYCTPAGYPGPGQLVGGTFFDAPLGWNATVACCKPAADQKAVDDVAYLGSVVDWIQERYSIDPRMIYVVGHSNGGFMVHRLLCDRSDLFAAGVSHAGVSWLDASRCQPEFPVSVLQIHSQRDEVISYGGGNVNGVYPGVLATLRDWAEILGCEGSLEDSGETLDLDLAVEGRETTVLRYAGCQGVDVEHWRKRAGKHWPTIEKDGERAELSEAVVDWLFRHAKP